MQKIKGLSKSEKKQSWHLIVIPEPTFSGDLAKFVERRAEHLLVVVHEPLWVVNVFSKNSWLLLLFPGEKSLK